MGVIGPAGVEGFMALISVGSLRLQAPPNERWSSFSSQSAALRYNYLPDSRQPSRRRRHRRWSWWFITGSSISTGVRPERENTGYALPPCGCADKSGLKCGPAGQLPKSRGPHIHLGAALAAGWTARHRLPSRLLPERRIRIPER